MMCADSDLGPPIWVAPDHPSPPWLSQFNRSMPFVVPQKGHNWPRKRANRSLAIVLIFAIILLALFSYGKKKVSVAVWAV